ncbi:MAG: cyclophilin type peptidyl-prolyl cis-trans isomerase [Sphingomonas bacterium]|nr:cyclophilin type peptidyl-prolyl cis-trans isomerase [Sphingomonas bacterium]
MIRTLACFALLALAAPSAAQDSAPAAPTAAPAPPAAPKPAVVHVTLQTSAGPILLELEKERAPVTTANFLKYVEQKRLDGATIYRAVAIADGFGLIQGGVRNDAKRVLPPIAHEPTSKTGLSHVSGTISMARAAPGSANGDFFITVGDMPSMDADPKLPGDNLGFAAFGHVVEGMEVVKTILVGPVSPTAGEGALKGQMLEPAIRIVSAKRTD